MTDWLRLPLAISEPEYIKWTAVKRYAAPLARYFHETLSRLKESDRLIIHHEFDPYDATDDVHAGSQILRLIETVPNELSGMFAFIEDHCSFNPIMNRLWVGTWLLRFWTTVFKLHKEHTKEIPSSGCGPPLGMPCKPTNFRDEVMTSMAVSWISYAEYYGLYS
jgi:hypothetical protein